MDNLICEYRSSESLEPAKCSLFAELCNIKSENDIPLFPVSICEYCLNNKTNHKKTLADDPFRSIYYKMVNNQEIEPAYRITDNLCLMKGQVKNVDFLDILDYQKHVFNCRKYKSCTISPTISNHKNCQTCTHGFHTHHLFKKNPNYKKIFHQNNEPVRYGKKVEKWAVGITTAPRDKPTIKRCYNSLVANGFDNILVFSEPGQELDKEWNSIYRQTKLGIFVNFALAILELYFRNIDADAYIITQDDIVYSAGCKEYLESFLWPDEKPHLIYPYAPSMARKPEYGWHPYTTYTPTAFIISPYSMEALVKGFGVLIDHCISQKSSFADFGIFDWVENNNYTIYSPWPSLAEHVGTHSTHNPYLHEHLLWSWQVIAPQALNSVEHWYVIDGRSSTIEQIKEISLISDHLVVISLHKIDGIITTLDPIQYIKDNSLAKWIALTNISAGVELIGDVSYEVLSRFDYTSKTINFSMGYINDRICYLKSGPCVTISNLRSELTLQSHDSFEQLEIAPFWKINSICCL